MRSSKLEHSVECAGFSGRRGRWWPAMRVTLGHKYTRAKMLLDKVVKQARERKL